MFELSKSKRKFVLANVRQARICPLSVEISVGFRENDEGELEELGSKLFLWGKRSEFLVTLAADFSFWTIHFFPVQIEMG